MRDCFVPRHDRHGCNRVGIYFPKTNTSRGRWSEDTTAVVVGFYLFMLINPHTGPTTAPVVAGSYGKRCRCAMILALSPAGYS